LLRQLQGTSTKAIETKWIVSIAFVFMAELLERFLHFSDPCVAFVVADHPVIA
jgi:hypothetical protein